MGNKIKARSLNGWIRRRSYRFMLPNININTDICWVGLHVKYKEQKKKNRIYIKKEWKIRNIYIFFIEQGEKHFYIYGCQIYDLAAPVSSYIDVSIVMTDFMPWFCFIYRIYIYKKMLFLVLCNQFAPHDPSNWRDWCWLYVGENLIWFQI